MTLILYSISGCLFAISLYRVAQAVFGLPSGKAVGAIQNIHGKRELAKRLQDALLPLVRLLSKLLPMSEYKQKRLEADFSRLYITQTPQDFVSSAMTKSLLLALIGLLFIPLGIPLLSLLTAIGNKDFSIPFFLICPPDTSTSAFPYTTLAKDRDLTAMEEMR